MNCRPGWLKMILNEIVKKKITNKRNCSQSTNTLNQTIINYQKECHRLVCRANNNISFQTLYLKDVRFLVAKRNQYF